MFFAEREDASTNVRLQVVCCRIGSLSGDGMTTGSTEKDEAEENAAINKAIAESGYVLWAEPYGYDLTRRLEAEQEIKGGVEYGSVPHGGNSAKE
jgi:hypothetical protein